MRLPECTYTGVNVSNTNIVYISAVSDELTKENIDHSVILKKKLNGWSFCTLAESLASIVITPKLSDVIAICIDGAIYSIGDTCKELGYVDKSDEGPSDLVHLKNAAYMNDKVVIVGMARRVYFGDAHKKWRAIDKDIFVDREHREIAIGLLAVDGFSHDDIYAAGLNGEIWHYNGHSWNEYISPTNVALTVILCNKNNVYIAGLSGVVIFGSGSNWKVMENKITTKDFWGIAKFKDEIYLSNYDGIFKIVKNFIEPVLIDKTSNLTTAYLSAGEDVIYSVGHKHIYVSKDGVSWSKKIIENISRF